MIIRLQGMDFRTGDRVAMKKKKPEYDNVVQAIGSKLLVLAAHARFNRLFLRSMMNDGNLERNRIV